MPNAFSWIVRAKQSCKQTLHIFQFFSWKACKRQVFQTIGTLRTRMLSFELKNTAKRDKFSSCVTRAPTARTTSLMKKRLSNTKRCQKHRARRTIDSFPGMPRVSWYVLCIVTQCTAYAWPGNSSAAYHSLLVRLLFDTVLWHDLLQRRHVTLDSQRTERIGHVACRQLYGNKGERFDGMEGCYTHLFNAKPVQYKVKCEQDGWPK